MVTSEERLSHLEGAYEHLATKADLQEVRVELRGEAEKLRVEMQELRAYVESAISKQTRWFAGILVVQTGVVTGLIVGLLKLLET